MAKLVLSFKKMTQEKFDALTTKDPGTFYRVVTEKGQDLYIGDQKLNNVEDMNKVFDSIEASNIVITDKDGNFTGETIDGETVKNVENVLAELHNKILDAKAAGKLSIDIENGADGTNIAKIVKFYQGDKSVAENKIGELNLPKDMFGVGGEVITIPTDADDAVVPEGLEKGTTYIKIEIGAGGEPFYIPADSLVEFVKGSIGDEITIAVDDTTHVITATINSGSIVKEKLAKAVQDSLDAADSAVQEVTEGTTPGAISVKTGVNGTPITVYVHGLSSVATSGKSTDVLYKEADGENPAVSVSDALNELEGQFTWEEVE